MNLLAQMLCPDLKEVQESIQSVLRKCQWTPPIRNVTGQQITGTLEGTRQHWMWIKYAQYICMDACEFADLDKGYAWIPTV